VSPLDVMPMAMLNRLISIIFLVSSILLPISAIYLVMYPDDTPVVVSNFAASLLSSYFGFLPAPGGSLLSAVARESLYKTSPAHRKFIMLHLDRR